MRGQEGILMSKSDEFISIDVTFLDLTDNAIRVRDHHTGREVWLPISQINDIEGRGFIFNQDYTLEVAEWILVEEGLI